MQSPPPQNDKEKQKRPLADWDGLGNEPRNENLAKIRGLGSFEKKENARMKERELGESDRSGTHKGR